MTNGQMYMFGELLTLQSRVISRQTRILSGEYKNRKIFHGNNIEFSENEKLQDEFNTMNRHIETMQEITDNFHKSGN
jgi:hypothetical protein